MHLEFPAPPALKNMVQSLWWHEELHTEDTAEHTLLPDAYVELGFHLGQTELEVESDVFQSLGHVYLLGLQDAPLRLRSHGLTRVLGVRFFAYGAIELLGLKTGFKEFQSRVAPNLSAFAQNIQVHLQDNQLEIAKHMLEAWLLELVSSTQSARVNDLFYQPNNDLKIRDFAQMLGIQERQLERIFLQQAGVPPKSLARLIRFERATAAIHADPKQSLTQLAFALGFADQAHFIRDFRALAGVSPKAFARGMRRNMSEKFNSVVTLPD